MPIQNKQEASICAVKVDSREYEAFLDLILQPTCKGVVNWVLSLDFVELNRKDLFCYVSYLYLHIPALSYIRRSDLSHWIKLETFPS